ncbi:MAG: 4-hydroxy-3-methylbut-2-enyl diphosphate reductase [Chthoniobacterales bacterium]|nr:4-hydroxy-3-methylbut-2-enyl diphosphate reductase [Chthoniobacterales bacterium]
MKIILAEHFGICFGVRDAIAQAERLAADGPLTILGELVHNPVVRESLSAQGVQEGSLAQTDSSISRAVMITAHGASDARREQWQAAGFAVTDGTCPLVRHAHEQLRALVAKGYFPVVLGQPGHVEVRGLTEDFFGAVVVGDFAGIGQLPGAARYGVIAQTTQPIEYVHALVAEIRRAQPQSEVRFVDTVCKPTKDRQLALRRLLAQAELIVVVGGRTSNNTRQLVEAARAAGRRSLHIERAEELAREDFAEVEIVGVTAGTSTLRETVDAVVARLRDFSLTPTNPNKNQI